MRIAREKARRMSRKELVDQLHRRLAEIQDLQHEASLLARELDLNQRVWRAHAQAVAACHTQVETEMAA